MSRVTTIRVLFWVAVAITIIVAFVFSANYPRFETAPPRFALADSDLQKLEKTNINDLVALRVTRTRLSTLTLAAIGATVWLPFFMGCMTFLILMLLYKNLRADVMLPGGVALIGVMLIWWLGWDGVGTVVIIAAVSLPLITGMRLRAGGREPESFRRGLHISIATFYFLTSFCVSLTTHLLLTSYGGFRPASQIDPSELGDRFEQLNGKRVPDGVSDGIAWRVGQIPSLNTATRPMTVFAANLLASVLFIVATLLYMVIVWIVIIPLEKSFHLRVELDLDDTVVEFHSSADRPDAGHAPAVAASPAGATTTLDADTRRTKLGAIFTLSSERTSHELPHFIRVLFAIPFYLAVGVAFSILFFNIYIAAAAKQNVMLVWADLIELSDDKYNELIAAKAYFGPTESLMRRMLDATRERSGDDLSATLRAARARYWPSAVVAQELPKVVESTTAATEMTLDPQLTFTDMLYFSFVSFTTTGYGDIRAISDELRFWTVFENIMEVLFTAMFFVVAMEPAGVPRVVLRKGATSTT